MEDQSTTFRKLDARMRPPPSPPANGNTLGMLAWVLLFVLGQGTVLGRLASVKVSVFNPGSWGRIASLHPTLALDYAIGRVMVGAVAAWLLFERETPVPNAVRTGLLAAFWFLAFEPGARHTTIGLLACWFGGICVIAALASPRRDAAWFAWRKDDRIAASH
jgi:hypothetical protein